MTFFWMGIQIQVSLQAKNWTNVQFKTFFKLIPYISSKFSRKFHKEFAAVLKEYLSHWRQKCLHFCLYFWPILAFRSAALTQWNLDQSGSKTQNYYYLFSSFVTGGLQFHCTSVICCCLSYLSVQSVFEWGYRLEVLFSVSDPVILNWVRYPDPGGQFIMGFIIGLYSGLFLWPLKYISCLVQ